MPAPHTGIATRILFHVVVLPIATLIARSEKYTYQRQIREMYPSGPGGR